MESTIRLNKILSFQASLPLAAFATGTKLPFDDLVQSNPALLQSIWDNSLVGMRLTNENGMIVAVNRMFCTLFGKTESELVQRPFTVVYSETEDFEKLERTYRKRFQRHEFSSHMERKLSVWSGKAMVLEVQSSFVEAGDGRRMLLSIFRDVTEMREAQDALRASEGLLRRVYDNVKDVIFSITREGIIVSVNPEFERKTGWSVSEWTGKLFHPLLHPDDLRTAWLSFRKSIRTQDSVIAELRVRTKEGIYLTGEFTWSPQFQRGELVSVMGAVRDITERKKTEKALQESESKYRNMFANSIQPMFQSSIEGKLLNANRAFLKLLGYDAIEEFDNINVADLYINPEVRSEIMEITNTKGYLSNVELQLKRKNGKAITVVEYSRAKRDADGRLVGFEGILEDVTARRAIEQKLSQYVRALETSQKELAQLNSEKDKLFSVLSHDLRSPFGSILGFCDILLTEPDQLSIEEQSQFLSFIKEAAQDQLELVNKLLDWSRLESGRIKMEMKEVRLAQLAERSINSLLGISRKKNITISSSLPQDLVVRGDEEMLQQVFTNIISNALKFTRDGGTILFERVHTANGEVSIAIRDNGIGIPQADLPKLFRVEEKYSRKGLCGEKGTGLGLPVCAEIMQKHGGVVRAESEQNNGTTFYLTFPAVGSMEGLNVLVVDDEEGVRILHARYIKRVLPEAHILYASNGKEGLECAEKYRPNAIITDYAMPTMDGFEMLSQLKKDPATHHIPVVIITGEDSKASHEAMKLTGAAGVFLKPALPEQLGEVLKKAIET